MKNEDSEGTGQTWLDVDKKVNCAKTKNSRSFVIVCWDMIPYLLQLLKDDDWVKK